MNPDLEKLQTYPFERLDALLSGAEPVAGKRRISLSIGEPRHAPPALVTEALARHLQTGLGSYPFSGGLAETRAACARWLTRRYGLDENSIDPDTMVLPVSGTREALFAFAQAAVDRSRSDAAVLMPNPFYQIYEGAALLAGAEPIYLNTLAENGFLPDLDAVSAATWRRCQVLYACSPGNPTGAVMDLAYLTRLLELADKFDFIVAADECYAEIYLDEDHPPPGLLEACRASGRTGFERCIVFHSLSKRSNVPGMRSGFVAGDPAIIGRYRLYRSYHGCAVPNPVQMASVAAWDDDAHVRENRARYREKFDTVVPLLRPVLDFQVPSAAFYLWAATPIDDEAFSRGLFAAQHVVTLPGSYLARDTPSGHPGRGFVRLSLVATTAECREAAERIVAYVSTL